MSSQVLPYTVKSHPITGVYSGKLGIWLFLASEVMLFGALFSSYILLKTTAPETGAAAWPTQHERHLSWIIGGTNTLLLIISSVTMVLSWAALKMNNLAKARMYILVTMALATVFLVLKITLEYMPHWHEGFTTRTSNFWGLYYTMTGLHGVHILGGIVVMAYLVGPGVKLWHKDPEYYTNRIECTGLYWHFVDLVWIFLFPTIYLMD